MARAPKAETIDAHLQHVARLIRELQLGRLPSCERPLSVDRQHQMLRSAREILEGAEMALEKELSK
jgi:hypothetical protein